MIGIRTVYKVAANTTFTSNVVLATVGLTSPLAALQKQRFRAWVPLTVGATGGIRLQVVCPAGITLIATSTKIINTVTPLITPAVQATSVAVTNALANAASHWVEVEGYIENGATAGNIDIQFAQNTSDPLTMTVLKGGQMEVIVES